MEDHSNHKGSLEVDSRSALANVTVLSGTLLREKLFPIESLMHRFPDLFTQTYRTALDATSVVSIFINFYKVALCSLTEVGSFWLDSHDIISFASPSLG